MTPLLTTLLLLLIQLLSCLACETGWYPYKTEKCLKYHAINVNFSEAESTCSKDNSTIASIGSKEEQDFVLALGRLHYTLSGVHWVWLGATRDTSDLTQFNWKDGSVFNYTNWRDGCPDNRVGDDCILMTIFRDRPSHWCNFRCESNYDHVVCQKEYTEDVSSPTSTPSYIFPNIRKTTRLPVFRRFPYRPRRPFYPMTIPSEYDECDFGWDFKNNKCYNFISQNVTGEQARYYCQRFGDDAQALTITSEAEQSWAVDYAFFKNEAKEAVWLGAVRVGPEANDIKWRDGSVMNFTNWSPHEPDNRNKSENCVAMNDMPKFFGMWLDAPCSLKFHLICEKKAKIPLRLNETLLEDVMISSSLDSQQQDPSNDSSEATTSSLVAFLMFVIIMLSLSTASLGYIVLNQKKEMNRNLRESRVNIYYASGSDVEYEEPKYSSGSVVSSPYCSTTTSSITYSPGGTSLFPPQHLVNNSVQM